MILTQGCRDDGVWEIGHRCQGKLRVDVSAEPIIEVRFTSQISHSLASHRLSAGSTYLPFEPNPQRLRLPLDSFVTTLVCSFAICTSLTLIWKKRCIGSGFPLAWFWVRRLTRSAKALSLLSPVPRAKFPTPCQRGPLSWVQEWDAAYD